VRFFHQKQKAKGQTIRQINMVISLTLSPALLIDRLRSPPHNKFIKHKTIAISSCHAVQNNLKKL
jgi:hypothetical protein